jgi:hypothetical protein
MRYMEVNNPTFHHSNTPSLHFAYNEVSKLLEAYSKAILTSDY